ncbi:MAG: protoporphyrinogen oxidase [Candidatus Eisenbacteria bacterium]
MSHDPSHAAGPTTVETGDAGVGKRLVIVGGGIAGLAAAHAAAGTRQSPPDISAGITGSGPSIPSRNGLEIVVLERDAEVGGKARTWRSGDWLVEGGPTGYTHTEPSFLEWMDELGLADERIPASAAAARRYIYVDGAMREVSPHPVKLVRSGLVSFGGLLRAMREPWIGRSREEDESLHRFASRRLGPQIADRLMAPMALGIYAGDAARLSVRAAFPKVAELERDHGSLIRGAIALKRQKRRASRGRPRGAGGEAGGGKNGGMAGPALSGFRDGMQTLPRHLAEDGRFRIRTRTPVLEITREGEGYRVRTAEDAWHADALVLATEPWAAADLVRGFDAELARELDGILCPPVTVVAFGYPPEIAREAPVGFGVLIRRHEGLRMLGVLWDSQIFPGRAPAEHLLIRMMYGGAVDPEAGRLDEGEIAALARRELVQAIGLDAAPIFQHVLRWPRAIPQYEIGHLARIARIEDRVRTHPGLFLTGNGLRGIAFARAGADGLVQGRAAGEHLIAAAMR